MVFSIVHNMFCETNEDGTLIIHDLPTQDDETAQVFRFMKCRMDWDFKKMEHIVDELSEIHDGIVLLADYYRESGNEFGSRPVVSADECDEDSVELAMKVWNRFFEGYDKVGESLEERIAFAEERLGEKKGKISYNAFISVRRLCIVLALKAPSVIIDAELMRLVQSYTLAFACTEMAEVDLCKDEYDAETDCLGAFARKDTDRIYEMLENDRSILPEVSVGAAMLINSIFLKKRLDLCRRYESFRDVLEEVLGTLTPRERTVLEKSYGLKDGVRRTPEEIALELNTFTPIITAVMATAFRRLRHPVRSKRFLCYFD